MPGDTPAEREVGSSRALSRQLEDVMSVRASNGSIRPKSGKAADGTRGSAHALHQTMRGFLDFVRREHPDELVTVKTAVDRQFDMTSMAFELEQKGRHPVLVFE